MTIDSPLDPRHSRLVALLYEELPPDEEQVLRAELARDPALRAEWDELNVARDFLGAWEIEERTPSFVFMEPPTDSTSAAPGPQGIIRGGIGRRGKTVLAFSGWGVAAAALLFVALAGRGARFERLDNGFALRFGNQAPARPAAPTSTAEMAALRQSGARERFGLTNGVPTDPAGHSLLSLTSAHAGGDEESEAFVTPAELDSHQDEMVNMVVHMLNEERARQDREWTSMLRSVYSDLNDRQFTGYRDLRGRIEAVNVGLMLGRSGAGTKSDGSTIAVPADTLKFKARPRQPNGRNWKYGDFTDEPERF